MARITRSNATLSIASLLMLVVMQSKPRIWLLGDKADQKSANPDVLESA